MEDNKEYMEDITKEFLPKKPKNNNNFKTKECKILQYNKNTKTLDIDFNGYGIRIHNVEKISGDTIEIKYKGCIGKSNFVYKM